MASKKNLKKMIKFISTELITEIFFLGLMKKDFNSEKADEIVMKIVEENRKYVLRANRADGKENPALVKTYYRKLRADWQKSIQEIVAEIEKL